MKPRTFDDVWAMFYPDRPISGLTEVDYEVTKSD